MQSRGATSPADFADYLASIRSEQTISKYLSAVNRFLTVVRENGYVRFSDLPPNFLRNYVSLLVQEGYAPNSVHVYLTGVRSYLEWLRGQGVKVANFIKPDTPRIQHTIRDVLSPDQISSYFEMAEDIPEPTRTAVRLLACTGLRASEIVSLPLSSIRQIELKLDNEPHNALALRATGKGGKMRTVPILEEGVPLLTEYLSGYRRKLPGSWIFPGFISKKVNKKGENHMSDRALREGLYQIRGPLGVDVTPHTLRRTYLTALHRRGVDPFTIAKIAGHANIQTLFKHYILPDEYDVVEAVHKKGARITRDED